MIDRGIAELELFLANVDHERSPMGSMLERAGLYDSQHWERPPRVRVPARFRGRREVSVKALPVECDRCAADLGEQETCGSCHWSHNLGAYRVTANITAEGLQGCAGEPSEDQLARLTRYAHVSRMFLAMQQESPRHASALAAYHGVEAARYNEGVYRPYNQLLAVMPLTERGKALCARVVEQGINGADTDPERMRLVHAQGKMPVEVTAVALEARRLYEDARRMWERIRKGAGES